MTQSEIDTLRESARFLLAENARLQARLVRVRGMGIMALKALDRLRRRWGRERRRLGAGRN